LTGDMKALHRHYSSKNGDIDKVVVVPSQSTEHDDRGHGYQEPDETLLSS